MCRLVHVYHTCGHWGQKRASDGCTLRGEQRRWTACSDSRTEGVVRDLGVCARCQRRNELAQQLRYGYSSTGSEPDGVWRLNDWQAPRLWNFPATSSSSSGGHRSYGPGMLRRLVASYSLVAPGTDCNATFDIGEMRSLDIRSPIG